MKRGLVGNIILNNMSEASFNSQEQLSKIFSYINLASKPKVVLSTGFFRQYSCSDRGCGACCHKIVLEYIMESPRWERFMRIYPQFVSNFQYTKVEGVTVYSDLQSDNKTRFCKYLNLESGRCRIHAVTPFPCEFVLSKFIDNKSRNRSILTTTYYGRGWNFLRVDHKTRGAMCSIGGYMFEKTLIDLELLRELLYYALLFNRFDTKLPKIIQWFEDHMSELEQEILPKTNIIFE